MSSLSDSAVLETARLRLRHLTLDDAVFILDLVNEPSWLRFIGDKRVRTIEDARQYIINGPYASYAQHGFGLYLAELKSTREPIGICGLLKRDTLEDVDIGFALRPRFWGNGYAIEAAAAVVDFGLGALRLKRIAAITKPDNASSINVLTKLGMRFDRMIRISEDEPELSLFVTKDEPAHFEQSSAPSECRNLSEVRAEIDEIDRRIIALIGERYEYVKLAARFKVTEADVRAPERLKAMLVERRRWAAEAGLDADMIEKLYQDLVAHFVHAELKLVEKRHE